MRDAALIGLGAGVALGLSPFDVPWVAFPALAGAMLLVSQAPDAWRAGRSGGLLGIGYFSVALHWIVEPFLVDVGRHGWMAPFALLFLVAGMALFWALAFAAAQLLAGPKAGIWRCALAFAVCFALAEYLRAVLFTGFPWAMLSMIWVPTQVRGVLAGLGPYGLSAATLLSAALVGQGIAHRHTVAALTGALLLAAGWGSGVAYLARIPADPPADAPSIRIVQPNAAQHLKWRSDMVRVFWDRMLTLSNAPGVRVPNAVIWPEVAVPYLWQSDPAGDALIAEAANGAISIVGAQRFDGADLRNSVGVLDAQGEAIALYDKFHLVPFGEYFPGGKLAAALGLQGLATNILGGFTAGPGPVLLDLRAQGLGHVLPLICYEVIFPRHAFGTAERADWIVQLTNDAWFGKFAGPQQHLAQARMRAVEQGLPVVRAANTGISALIDPAGRVVSMLPLDTYGALDVALPDPVPPPLYARWCNLPFLSLLCAGVLVLVVTRRRGA